MLPRLPKNFYNPYENPYGSIAGQSAAAYANVIGHAPKIVHMSTQVMSLGLVSGSVNVIAQTDEFVTYGTASITPTVG